MTPQNQLSRRAVNLGAPFYLPLTLALTGVAGETIEGETNPNQNVDLTIRGGITDLETSQVQFSMTGLEPPAIWSTEKVAIKALLGAVDSPRPISYWPRPTFMRRGRRIEANALNVQGEGPGTVVFICDQPAPGMDVAINDPQTLGAMKVIAVDSQLTGVASEQPDASRTEPQDFNYLLYGFYTDLTEAAVKIIDIDGVRWMTDWTPIWAIAGRPSSAVAVQMLRQAYFIPAGRSLEFLFKNDAVAPDAAGQVYLYGQRLQ